MTAERPPASPPRRGGLGPIRRLVLAQLRDALGEGGSAPLPLDDPPGDPGLFGPASLAWRVHADLGSMLIGGYSALMLQMLHPLAMAGVEQHSAYREDPLGRLHRTARYVAGTTYGGRPLVHQLVDQVRTVHTHVRGVAPDGRPYRADDPHLLAFVHTCEVWGFVTAYQRYGPRPLLRPDKDAYLDEVAVLADLLGADPVPRSVSAVRAYFRAIRPELEATADARSAFAFLRTAIGRRPTDVVAHRIVAEAAIDLLPGFARAELGIAGLTGRLATGVVPGSGRLATRAAAASLAAGLRLALGPSLVRSAAEARVAAGATIEEPEAGAR